MVASYNVHGWVGADGRVDPDRSARVLAELDADVVGLQEVECSRREPDEPPLLDALAERLGYRALRGPTLASGLYGNAVLLRCAPRRVSRIDLSVAGREPRGALDVELETGVEPVRVIVTHLGLRLWERRLQVQRLIRALGEDSGTATVLVGDMNEWVRGAGALRPLHRRLGRAPALRTFPARRPLLPLDRIWTHPRSRLAALHVHRTPLSRAASDHLPIRAEIDLGTDPAECSPVVG